MFVIELHFSSLRTTEEGHFKIQIYHSLSICVNVSHGLIYYEIVHVVQSTKMF